MCPYAQILHKMNLGLEQHQGELFYVKFMRNFYAALWVIHVDYVIFYIEFTPFHIFYIRIFINFTWYCNYYAKFQNCKFFKKKHASFILIFMQKYYPIRKCYDP